MNAETIFLVVLSVACVIRHILELAYLSSSVSKDFIANQCGKRDRKDIMLVHGLSLVLYVISVWAFLAGSPQIGFPAVGVTFITDGLLTTWCPPFQK